MAAYISEIVRVTGIEESIRYRTLVENASKHDVKWKVTTQELKQQDAKREVLVSTDINLDNENFTNIVRISMLL